MNIDGKSISIKEIKGNFPIKTFFILIGIWIVLAVLNFLSLKYWYFTGTDLLFPFSVLYPSSFLWSGWVFSILFLLAGIFFYQKIDSTPLWVILFLCLLLVFLGNMEQGNLDIAFMQPFYLKGRQYYTDAVKIVNAEDWLKNFTRNQDTFQLHTTTHPPFVTLLHYYILKIFNGSLLALGFSFFLISSIFFFILKEILQNLEFDKKFIKKVLLFSAVIPSINIYMLVSIDGIILMTSSLLLLGIIRILKKGKVDAIGFILCLLSILLTNLLTFSGLFLIAFLGLYAVIQLYYKKIKFLVLTMVIVSLYIMFFLVIYQQTGYNHLLAFFKASSSENPGGFILFHKPYIYFCTRIQDICEILLFLSFGFIAALMAGGKYKFQLFSVKKINLIFLSAIVSLMLMFLSGAYGTGETARACLFIVPFFIILTKEINQKTFTIIYFLSLFQTFEMQLIGNFYW